MVRSGCMHLALMSVIRRPLVLLHIGTVGKRSLSSSSNRFCLAGSCSTIASITSPIFSASFFRLPQHIRLSAARTASSWVFRPLSARILIHSSAFFLPFKAFSILISTMRVRLPARALIAAMALPIIPLPITATLPVIQSASFYLLG